VGAGGVTGATVDAGIAGDAGARSIGDAGAGGVPGASGLTRSSKDGREARLDSATLVARSRPARGPPPAAAAAARSASMRSRRVRWTTGADMSAEPSVCTGEREEWGMSAVEILIGAWSARW
jgi:hypothetical protein